MPKSKRNKQVSLTKKKKNTLELKKHIVQEVQTCVDKYANIFVFSVNNMRNNRLKAVRDQWKDSRFFFGKNKVMALALGRSMEEDYKPNLHKVSKRLKGQCGLLFTNKNKDDILGWFNSFSEADYARSGNTASYSVCLPEGPLPQFPHSLEPYLRQLGLPTTLQKGVICLVKEHQVCKEGDVLTPEAARILKLLGHEMVEFKVNLDCMWSSDGSFVKLSSDDEVFEAGKGKMMVDDDDSDEEGDEKHVHEEEPASQENQTASIDLAGDKSDEDDDIEEAVSTDSAESLGSKQKKKKHSLHENSEKNNLVVKEIADGIVNVSFSKKSGEISEPVDDQDAEMQVDSVDENVVSEKSDAEDESATTSQKGVSLANDGSDEAIAKNCIEVTDEVADKEQNSHDSSISLLPPEIDQLIAEEKTKISSNNKGSESNEIDDVEVGKQKKRNPKRKSEVTSEASLSVNVEEKNDEIEGDVKRKTPLSKIKDMAKKMGADLSSPEDKSPVFRTLRNRTVKVDRKKKKK